MNAVERLRKEFTDTRAYAFGVSIDRVIQMIDDLPPDDPWNPITTAPDDGLPFDVWACDEVIQVCRRTKTGQIYRGGFEVVNATHWKRDKPPRTVETYSPTCPSRYGYCPECGAPGVMRERRINGNDRCKNGCIYPSANAVMSVQPPRTGGEG